jgi:hypothetical protein
MDPEYLVDDLIEKLKDGGYDFEKQLVISNGEIVEIRLIFKGRLA